MGGSTTNQVKGIYPNPSNRFQVIRLRGAKKRIHVSHIPLFYSGIDPKEHGKHHVFLPIFSNVFSHGIGMSRNEYGYKTWRVVLGRAQCCFDGGRDVDVDELEHMVHAMLC